jgi:hypothetical protein
MSSAQEVRRVVTCLVRSADEVSDHTAQLYGHVHSLHEAAAAHRQL